MYNLKRFVDAQQRTYQTALAEVSNGRKQSHWMWFIFPQIQGLGYSETAKYYAITDLREAAAFLRHPVLGSRLLGICNELLRLQGSDAHEIFGSPDDMKLKSSMTLFSSLDAPEPVFGAVLNKFFGGEGDHRTLRILEQLK
jgi:uncharacterized protein (DUF1810 family)